MKRALSPYTAYRRSSDIHGTVLYPAVMVAPMQRAIIEPYLSQKEGQVSICDPFVGSGTSLYEAKQVAPDARLFGSDINPLATLITKVKLQGVNDRIEDDVELLAVSLSAEDDDFEPHYFPKIEKWFLPEIKNSLSRVRNAVASIEDEQNRLFFWCMMIDIVRKYSNSRSSTYKLHMRKQEQIDRMQDAVVDDFLHKVRSEYSFFQHASSNRFFLNNGDSVDYLKSCRDDAFDVCVTSPPYGDNATTVPYGQYSMLALQWIEEKDLNLKGWELGNYSTIDSRSLGGPSSPYSQLQDDLPVELRGVVGSIRMDKRTKVERFMSGYCAFLDEMVRVTADVMILTLGNRTVDGKAIDLYELTKSHLMSKGCSIKDESVRSLPSYKRIPAKTSMVEGKPVSSMREEYVLVAQKG